MREFVLAIDQRRQQLGLTHEALAKRLGCSPSAWSRALSGDTDVSCPVILGALREWPDLAFSLVAVLRQSKDSTQESAARSA